MLNVEKKFEEIIERLVTVKPIIAAEVEEDTNWSANTSSIVTTDNKIKKEGSAPLPNYPVLGKEVISILSEMAYDVEFHCKKLDMLIAKAQKGRSGV